MKRSFRKNLPWLLMLALLAAGVDAALSETLHAAHVETSADGSTGGTGEPEDHEGHCCHAAGHLIGAVSGAIASLRSPAWTSLPTGVSVLSEPGQAPPTPPPTH